MSARPRRRNSGGRSAKSAARQHPSVATAAYIDRKIPYYELLSDEALELIEHNADPVLEAIGIEFKDFPEALRLLEVTGTPITNGLTDYLEEGAALNSSPRPKDFVGGYPPELEQLVAAKEKYIIDKLGYEFSEMREYP